jgi:hypothetical protein
MSTIPRVVFRECILLFFRWQLPYSAILDPDAFMLEWSSGASNGRDFSPALLHAVCALGALMSHDQNIRQLADIFSAAANEELSANLHFLPSLTTCQALLLCAIFDVGRGNRSKAWMSSGEALRV